ncbi:hypothetical protein C497_16322 [Halalkalicoccus jeotgali B3]|nr:hypothetical protein C497_16322 [Halalkalicoccus jeotgali B3]
MIGLVVVTVVLTGCVGWGTDGPADANTTGDDSGNLEEQQESNGSDGSATDERNDSETETTDADGDDSPEEDGTSSPDDTTPDESEDSTDSTSENDGSEDGRDDTGTESDYSSETGTDDDASNDSSNEESTDRNSDEEQETHTLTVYAGEAYAVEGVDITLERHSDGATTTRTTDENGRVDFTVIDGEYTVSGTDPNGDSDSAEVTVDGENVARHLLLAPENPEVYDVSLTVTDARTGEPIEGAILEGEGDRHPNTGDQLLQVRTGADGTGTEEAYEGTYDGDLRADGYESQTVEVTVEEGTELTYEMEPESESGSGNATASLAAPA